MTDLETEELVRKVRALQNTTMEQAYIALRRQLLRTPGACSGRDGDITLALYNDDVAIVRQQKDAPRAAVFGYWKAPGDCQAAIEQVGADRIRDVLRWAGGENE